MIEFLLERIAEDEASTRPWNDRAFVAAEIEMHAHGCMTFAAVERSDAECDCDGPKRWRRECQAKRLIVGKARLLALATHAEHLPAGVLSAAAAYGEVLAVLALPYAGHADYDEAWGHE